MRLSGGRETNQHHTVIALPGGTSRVSKRIIGAKEGSVGGQKKRKGGKKSRGIKSIGKPAKREIALWSNFKGGRKNSQAIVEREGSVIDDRRAMQ